jgi:hypothetical protein
MKNPIFTGLVRKYILEGKTVLQAYNLARLNWRETVNLVEQMEEMANAPKEEYGKRQPGERQAREIYGQFELGTTVHEEL